MWSKDRHMSGASQSARRCVDRCCLGLGTSAGRSSVCRPEGDWNIAAFVRRIPSRVRRSMVPNRGTRIGRHHFVLRQTLHHFLFPHQAQGLGLL